MGKLLYSSFSSGEKDCYKAGFPEGKPAMGEKLLYNTGKPDMSLKMSQNDRMHFYHVFMISPNHF